MRIKIEISSQSAITLPCSYNACLQGLVYAMLNPHAATWLHEHGFPLEEKQFRMFTFSEIMERGRIENQHFVFPSQISFYVASPVDWILEQVAHNAIRSPGFHLGRNRVKLVAIHIMKPERISAAPITIKALTPIEVHTTFDSADNRRKTYFYTPFEEEFTLRVNQNLKHKWTAFYRKECPYQMQIRPLFKGNRNQRVRSFVKERGRPFRINGWVGHFKLEGDPQILQFAHEAGLGSGNSKGFGMFELV